MTTRSLPSVLVLGGGPDAEREVSLKSAASVAKGLAAAGHVVHAHTIGRIDAAGLAQLPGEVVFPVLHGAFGEGGALQDMLESDWRPFVGCGPRAARLAMDKIATKLAALRAGIATPQAAVINADDQESPIELPVVVKPVHEGSSVGLFICKTRDDWERAIAFVREDQAQRPNRDYMVEAAVLGGREITVPLLDGVALSPIEIRPAQGVYDYEAKYNRNDTRYLVDPPMGEALRSHLKNAAERLARELGVAHLGRVDFMVDAADSAFLLEVNTMPGFTDHSLLPMSAAHTGLDMAALTSRLVSFALRDRGARQRQAAHTH